MYSCPPVNTAKYIHKTERSLHFSQEMYEENKFLPKIIPFSESEKRLFMTNQNKLRKGQFFTFQMLQKYQEWLQFTLTYQELKIESNIFILLRALPLDVQEKDLIFWTELRQRKCHQALRKLRMRLKSLTPKYYYYIIAQIQDDNAHMIIKDQVNKTKRSINLRLIEPDDFEKLFNFVSYYDRGNQLFANAWTLRWRFFPPESNEYDSFDEFYLKRVRQWNDQDPNFKRLLQMRMKFARYAAFIHVLLARGWKYKTLMNMDYFLTVSLLQTYCGDKSLDQHIPFFKGIVFYAKILQSFYFHVDTYVSEISHVNGRVFQASRFGQKYWCLNENQVWVLAHVNIEPNHFYQRPEFKAILRSIPQDLTHIQWQGMDLYQQYLPKLQSFEEVLYPQVCQKRFPQQQIVAGKNLLQAQIKEKCIKIQSFKEEQFNEADVEISEQQAEKPSTKMEPFKGIQGLISRGYVKYPLSKGNRLYVQCKCGEKMIQHRSHAHKCVNKYYNCLPSQTHLKGFIEFYRSSVNRHYGLCLHCDTILSMDKSIQKSHPTSVNYSHSVLNYALDPEKMKFHQQKLMGISRVNVTHSSPIPFKNIIQDNLQLPQHISNHMGQFPQIYPQFEYGHKTINLSSTVEGMIAQSLQKGDMFGPVGGNIVPSHIALSDNWKKIKISSSYYWVPLCHYTLASLQVVGDETMHNQPNIRLIFAYHEHKLYGFWMVTKRIPMNSLLVAYPDMIIN